MRIILVLLAILPALGLAQDLSIFSRADCEAFLLGHEGRSRLTRARGWLSAFPPHRLEVDRMRSLQAADTTDEPDLAPLSMLDRADRLGEEIERIRARAAKRKTRRIPAAEPALVTPLTALERAALGLSADGNTPVLPDALSAVIEGAGNHVHVRLHENGKQAGGFALDLNTAVFGFPHNVLWWQACYLNSRWTPVPCSQISEYIDDQAWLLLTRNNGGVQFGYLIGGQPAAGDMDGTQPIDIQIVLVRECARPPLGRHEFYFPLPGRPPGHANLCLTRTGLTLNTPLEF